ncbi:hypothetical protein KJ654_04365, partial [Patescibacteria group bacterium]|nr:hypothetical protein [Patescibacteria group bacterium]MBU1966966.1 hypothetical protein [Patescibacteria group bacterium]
MAVSVELKRAWREFRKEHTAPIYSREAQLAMGDWAGGLAQGLLSTEVLGFIGNKITQSNKKLYKRIVEKQGQVRIDVQRDGNFRVNPQAITDTSLPRYLLRKPDVIPSVINDLIVSPEVIKDTLVKQATRITFGEKTAPSEVTSDQIGMLAQAVLGLAIEAKINLRDLQTATSSNPGKKQSLTESVFKIPFDEFFIPEKVVSGCLFDEEKGVYTDTRGREHHLTINSQGETFVLVKGVGGRYYFKTING